MNIEVGGKTYTVRIRYDGCYTRIQLLGQDDIPHGIGIAVCSVHDQFCRATGRKIAFGRAVKDAFEKNKDERRLAWEQYFKQIGLGSGHVAPSVLPTGGDSAQASEAV